MLALLGAGGLLALLLHRQKNKALWHARFALALTILSLSTIVGCGGSGSKAATYQVTVTGTAGAKAHSVTYSLIVK